MNYAFALLTWFGYTKPDMPTMAQEDEARAFGKRFENEEDACAFIASDSFAKEFPELAALPKE